MNFRNQARQFLKRAEDEIVTHDDHRLKYAALELRMAMEALTYDRAVAYKDEFPPSEYETWQPSKVLSVLLEIEPMADQDSTFAIGIEESIGIPSQKMQHLGSEKVLNMATLKKHYDALGSYLHVETIKKVRTGALHDPDKLRSRCEEIVGYIKDVLSSSVFNVTLGNFANMDCTECELPIRKRLPHDKEEVYVECYNCPASYKIFRTGGGKVEWHSQQEKIKCANKECNKEIIVWHREIKPSKGWTCQDCGGRNYFKLGVYYYPKKSDDKVNSFSGECGDP